MKKIGILCLVLVFALGSLGIGYAHWSDQLFINGTVYTGEVLIGFVDQYTDDDDALLDPVNVDQIPVCAPSPRSDKHVATTTCVLLEERTHCDGTTPAVHGDNGDIVYGKMHIDMDKVYPGYAPSVYFDIANAGSIPVIITGARVIMTSVGGVETAVDIPLPKCEPVQIDLDGVPDPVTGLLDDDIAIGFTGPEHPQQIEPCEVFKFDLHFMFKQGLDECTDYDFEIEINAIQWNKA